MTFTIGADPEVFVKKNGKPISVHETGLPGSKKEPFKTAAGAVQRDGMAAEFNINPSPINDFEAFNQNIVRTIGDLRTLVNKEGEVNLALQPVMDFDPEYLKAQPDEATELGCDPDFCAYTLKPNPRPNGEVSFRTAAGHVHIGWGADIPIDNPEHMEICAGFVKMLDATVGLYMTFIDREPRRRELYGKAGAFRPKPYGVEYRTPSNLWLKNRDRRGLLHKLVNLAINKHTQGYSIDRLTGIKEDFIRSIIDNGDHVAAKSILDNNIIGADAPFGAPKGSLLGYWTIIKAEMQKEEVIAKAA